MKNALSLIVVAAVALSAVLPISGQAKNLAKKRAHLIREQEHRTLMGQKKYDTWVRNHQGARNTDEARRRLHKWQLHHLAVDQKIQHKRERVERKAYAKRLRHRG